MPTALPHPTAIPTQAWRRLPKGLYLFFVYGEMDGLYALSLSDNRVSKVLERYVESAVLMPDHRRAVLFGEAEPEFLDLQTGETAAYQLPVEFAHPFHVAYSPVSEDVIWVAGYPLHDLPINGDGSFLYYFHSGTEFEFRIQGGWPVWSPNGRYVAYEKETYQSPPGSMTVRYADITLLAIPCTASGSGPCHEVKLTHSSLEAEARKPSWAPDSHTLAYECSVTNPDGAIVAQDICLIGQDGGGFRQVTRTEDLSESFPLWSPRGDALALQREVSSDGLADLYLLNVTSDAVTNLTNTPDLAETPLFWWDNE